MRANGWPSRGYLRVGREIHEDKESGNPLATTSPVELHL